MVLKKAFVKQDVKSKMAAKKWFWWYNGKKGTHKFTRIIIKNFAIGLLSRVYKLLLLSQPFFGHHFGFHKELQ